MSRPKKKGFTLVELVVVLVIMTVILGIAIPSVLHYMKMAEFRKNEENAKTVYLACLLYTSITEAGTLFSGNIKSAVGLGIILYQGIGDTIRVSLTGDPSEEVKSAKRILKTLGLRNGGIEVVSCPTCGRTQIDLIGLANKVEDMVQDIPLDIKVAVMGCVVNGPGEAKEADIGIAGGKRCV